MKEAARLPRLSATPTACVNKEPITRSGGQATDRNIVRSKMPNSLLYLRYVVA